MTISDEAVKEWVSGVLAGIYKPEPNEEIYEWAERTLRIPATENPDMAGMRWSSELSPYVRELMRWAKTPGKSEFWIRKSSQTGFTMAILIIMCWFIVHRPCPIGYAINSIEEARKISKTRLRRWITYNRLLDEIGEEEDAMNNLTFFFRSATVYMLSAATTGDWQNKTMDILILDELDIHPRHAGQGTTVDMARGRVKRSANSKIIGFSTPGDSNQITIEYKKGSMDEIRFPFPCCGHVQAMKKENLIFSTKEFKHKDGTHDLAKVREGAYMKCEKCGGRLFDHQKRAAMQKCEYVATNPRADPRVRSVHIWDAYSPFVTFGDLAVLWIGAEGNTELLEGLYRRNFGEPYERSGRTLKHDDVLSCIEQAGHVSHYQRGVLPFVPAMFCMAVDIQKVEQKAVKCAFDKQGNCYVIDWTITLELDDAIAWGYEATKDVDGTEHYIHCAFIDEGFRPMDVRRACLSNLPTFWPVKGRPGSQMRGSIHSTSPSLVDGEELITYHIAEDQFKWQLQGMILDRKKRLKRGETCLYLPFRADADEDFIDELCNEHPQKAKNKLNQERWEWKAVGKNDFWDCIKYNLAIWSLMRPELVKEGLAVEAK